VGWNDVTKYLEWLNGRESMRYRLLTEAEWEYACRAGTESATAFGSDLSSREANFDGNYPYNGASNGPYLERTASVGTYRPNAFGLYDLHGNVYEWCEDWYGGKLPGGTNPTGVFLSIQAAGQEQQPRLQAATDRVVRGGCYNFSGKFCRSADRFMSAPGDRFTGGGFRLAAVPPSPAK
jgi:formylglycine-generating enzyme required for sulfatase activity